MPRASKVCSASGCPTIVPRTSKRTRCADCEREAEQARGTAHTRGYDRAHETRFRDKVLADQPICTLCRRRPSQHADHHPLSRREQVAQGLDPNKPEHGRGLCQPCHARETAAHQPGGWHANH